ncbi:glycosyltransferase involved in cell wall biosynthesis [Granulicella aggregans]|uniref:Glycosyltransferase involved in cell wall biosynthesis n=1 Tax=Granulicella aggregans TaxID=474949 RepID=A0A7W8E5V8_9BACT|nr:glycosyltransferase family A protein [Granulicella aggregans]MBB5058595.1 glycosyltransferase involved in cell wall biosynthesis [Granulicella aggregans]
MSQCIQLTIGIPTYNRSALLAEQLNRLSQEGLGDEVEILVSDNASLDSTLEIAESFRERMGRHFVISPNERNLGFDGNIFTLYKKARGRYLWFLSDDDSFFPGTVARLLQVVKSEKDCGLIALPGFNMLPYESHEGGHIIQLLPWSPTGSAVSIVLGKRFGLTGNEFERFGLVSATSQISHCLVRRGVRIEDADRGGGVLQSRIANLNLLSEPHYYILSEPTIKQGDWTEVSHTFMESTFFGIRELYSSPDMQFTREVVDFASVQNCLFAIRLLHAYYTGENPTHINFPPVGRGFADRLMRLFGGAYHHLDAAVEDLLEVAKAHKR